MEEKELLEIEVREIEQTKKNISEMAQGKKIDDINLLYKDKFDFEKKNVCHSVSPELIPMLVGVCEKVLVDINPHPSPEWFNEKMGFSVNQIIEWRKEGWAETVLTLPPRAYSGLGYLDELIQISPSRSIRHQLYCEMLVGGADRLKSVFSEGTTVFKQSVARPSFVEFLGELTAKRYRDFIATNYMDLSVLGFSQIVKTINELARTQLEDAEMLCGLSTMFLVTPLIDSLKKTTAYPSAVKDLASRFYEIAKPRGEVFFVPCWIGDLYQNLGLTVPVSMDTDKIEAVRKNSGGFIRAVKSLDEEIDKTVRERPEGQALERNQKAMIIAKKEEFRERWWNDVVPAFKEIRETEQVWSIVFTLSIVCSYLTLLAFRGVLDSPFAKIPLSLLREIKKMTDPAAEYFVRFWERNPIHVGFYKVDKEVRKLKRSS